MTGDELERLEQRPDRPSYDERSYSTLLVAGGRACASDRDLLGAMGRALLERPELLPPVVS